MLITTEELEARLRQPGWVVFDCRHDLMAPARGAQWYAESHLPGAHFAAVDGVLSGPLTGRNGRHPLPKPEDFAAFLASRGVSPEVRVVAYDDAGGQYAARFWWLARWVGVADVRVLDGGWSRWLAERRPTTAEVPRPQAKAAWPAQIDSTRCLTAADVLAGLQRGSIAVVDARAPERYRGETEPIDPVAGRIPTARNRPYGLNLAGDKTFRPAAELRREFEAVLGPTPPDRIVHQCGSGITACANLFAMELAGLTGSRLYAGSWSEWIADPARPVARGEPTPDEARLLAPN